jgi:hypothetical protein
MLDQSLLNSSTTSASDHQLSETDEFLTIIPEEDIKEMLKEKPGTGLKKKKTVVSKKNSKKLVTSSTSSSKKAPPVGGKKKRS